MQWKKNTCQQEKTYQKNSASELSKNDEENYERRLKNIKVNQINEKQKNFI